MLDELNDKVVNYNDALRALLDYVKEHVNDPFFDTKDGKDVLNHTADIAMASRLLSMKLAILKLQNLSFDLGNIQE